MGCVSYISKRLQTKVSKISELSSAIAFLGVVDDVPSKGVRSLFGYAVFALAFTTLNFVIVLFAHHVLAAP
jgi:hypothetical protein